MKKFKIGDKVIYKLSGDSIPFGEEGEIIGYASNEGYEVLFPNCLATNCPFKDSWGVSLYEIELIGSEVPKKFNSGKPRTDLISGEFILGLGQALQYGAEKYGEDKSDVPNYLKGEGHLYSDLIGSLERHAAYFKSGVNIDEESSIEHILLVAVNAMFLYNYRISGSGIDNRVILKKNDDEL